MNTTTNLWPSQQASKSVPARSYGGPKIQMDHKSGFLSILFVLLLVAGVLAGLYFLVLDDLFSQLSTLTDVLQPKPLTTAGGQ